MHHLLYALCPIVADSIVISSGQRLDGEFFCCLFTLSCQMLRKLSNKFVKSDLKAQWYHIARLHDNEMDKRDFERFRRRGDQLKIKDEDNNYSIE